MSKGQGGVPLPSIGKHLAVCNLFREADRSVQATVASAIGALGEFNTGKAPGDKTPQEYVERLIVEAARNIIDRRPDLLDDEFAAAWGKFEAKGYQYGGDALENVRFGWTIAKGLIEP